MFFKKKNVMKVTKEMFGNRILSRFVLTSGERYVELSKKLHREDVFDYLTYLQYLLYMSEKILNQKYHPDNARLIVISSIDGIVDMLDFIEPKAKPELKEILRNQYSDTIAIININIFNEDGIHQLATRFEVDLQLDYSFTNHMDIFVEFSMFIKYHTNDILSDKVEII